MSRHSAYRVRVVCEGHAAVARAVDGSVSSVELAVPVDPSAVVGFTWPDELPAIPGVDFGLLHLAGDVGPDAQRFAALLNIWAKLSAVWLGVAPAASFVDEVLEVRRDRLIARVAPELEDQLEASRRAEVLDLVSGALHDPPAGYELGASYKTRDRAANLQVSLFVPAPDAGAELGELLADVDVDEARGFAHFFDVVRHAVTGDKTDPVEVQQLLAAQGIDAGWRPRLA